MKDPLTDASSWYDSSVWHQSLIRSWRTIGKATDGHVRIAVFWDVMDVIAVRNFYPVLVTVRIEDRTHHQDEYDQASNEDK